MAPRKQIVSQQYTGPDRRALDAHKSVSFDPTINLGHLLTFVGFLVTIGTAWSALDKRVSLAEADLAVAKQQQRELDSHYRETLGDMRADMKEMRRTLEELARNSQPGGAHR